MFILFCLTYSVILCPAFMNANCSCRTDCPEEGAQNSKYAERSIKQWTILKGIGRSLVKPRASTSAVLCSSFVAQENTIPLGRLNGVLAFKERVQSCLRKRLAGHWTSTLKATLDTILYNLCLSAYFAGGIMFTERLQLERNFTLISVRIWIDSGFYPFNYALFFPPMILKQEVCICAQIKMEMNPPMEIILRGNLLPNFLNTLTCEV